MSDENYRSDDIENVWKAIRSIRERFDNYVMKANDRIITLESWRVHFESNHNDLKALIGDLKKSVDRLTRIQNEQQGAEKMHNRMVALYAALGAGGSLTATEILTRFF